MGLVRRVCRNVKRWRDASIALRWTAAAMREAARGFRRLKAKSQLPQLCAALSADRQKADPAFSVAQTEQATERPPTARRSRFSVASGTSTSFPARLSIDTTLLNRFRYGSAFHMGRHAFPAKAIYSSASPRQQAACRNDLSLRTAMLPTRP
jgi:hypothetical protein